MEQASERQLLAMENAEVKKFNPARPHDQICGQPGLAFKQDNAVFDGQGKLVTDFKHLKPVDAPEPQPTPEDGSIPKCIILEEDPKPEKDEAVGIDNMHWKTLQKLCGLYGIKYETREQAISALKGR